MKTLSGQCTRRFQEIAEIALHCIGEEFTSHGYLVHGPEPGKLFRTAGEWR